MKTCVYWLLYTVPMLQCLCHYQLYQQVKHVYRIFQLYIQYNQTEISPSGVFIPTFSILQQLYTALIILQPNIDRSSQNLHSPVPQVFPEAPVPQDDATKTMLHQPDNQLCLVLARQSGWIVLFKDFSFGTKGDLFPLI